MNNIKRPPASDSCAVLRSAADQLSTGEPLLQAELIELERSCRSHLYALMAHYIQTQKLGLEYEEQLCLAIHHYLQQLTDVFSSSLRQSTPQISHALSSQVLLQNLDNLALFAKWHYLRYQPLPPNYWLQMHAAYRQSEQLTNTAQTKSRRFQARYVQALMLDTLNRSNMLKSEIELVDGWLNTWCQNLSLAKKYDKNRQLFFVDLRADRGARRIRELNPETSYRYWHVDTITAKLEEMRLQLEQNVLPQAFANNTPLPNAMRVLDYLLAEWSREGYKRQRRGEVRTEVSKLAQVVHGVPHVCQQVKNLMYADVSPPFAQGQLIENGWTIKNESNFGFGALVNVDFNRWLKPGCLIALDYQLNPDMTVVGVVRRIQQQAGPDGYVGIEVLSHIPSYVRLQHLANSGAIMSEAEPFPALYLGKDEEHNLPATLVMPALDFVQSDLYELRAQQYSRQVRLGRILEQQDGWTRVVADIATTAP
ncbi:MAG: hypothetical protein ABI475_02095 [Methylophilaceae bacterium]